MFELENEGTAVKTFWRGMVPILKNKGENPQNALNLQPSLASLGDGLPGRAGSQRDEAKMQAPVLPKT